jgi:hypothetical protein
MTIVESKGGVPYILRETFNSIGRKIRLGVIPKWFCIRVKEFPCKIYFSEDDYNDDVNYIGVNPPSEETPNGEYIGSHDGKDLWIKGFNGSSEVELVATSAVIDLYLGEFSAGSVLVPTATIVTTKVGTFSSTWKGSGTLYIDPGDGGLVEPLVLTTGGVAWNHAYPSAGSKTIRITGALDGVTTLYAPNNNITNNLSEIVSGLANLVNLYLNNNSISGDISAVSGLTNLVNLSLYNNSISGDISAVSGLTNLVNLHLYNNSISGDISAVSGLTNLVTLYLYNNALSFTYSQFPAWSGNNYDLSSCVLTSQEVGDLLLAAANGGMNNCTYIIDGTNPVPPSTQEVTDAIATLLGNEVTLYVNT